MLRKQTDMSLVKINILKENSLYTGGKLMSKINSGKVEMVSSNILHIFNPSISITNLHFFIGYFRIIINEGFFCNVRLL